MTLIQFQKQSRTATIFIWIGVSFVIMAVLFVFFWKPKTDESVVLKINEKLEVLRQAEENRIKKEEAKDTAAISYIKYIQRRDSLNDLKIDKISYDLKNVRNENKINDIKSFGSPDLIRAYAGIERQYNAAK